MRQNVVYPDLITNRSFVEDYLNGLNITGNSYFQNVLNIQVRARLHYMTKPCDIGHMTVWSLLIMG